MNPLFDYLSENLTTLGNNLLPSVFERQVAYQSHLLTWYSCVHAHAHAHAHTHTHTRTHTHTHTHTHSITATLWDVTVATIDQLSRVTRKKDLVYHRRLLDTLTSLRDFYYCEGQGVTGRALDSEAYLVRLKLPSLSNSHHEPSYYTIRCSYITCR